MARANLLRQKLQLCVELRNAVLHEQPQQVQASHQQLRLRRRQQQPAAQTRLDNDVCGSGSMFS